MLYIDFLLTSYAKHLCACVVWCGVVCITVWWWCSYTVSVSAVCRWHATDSYSL